MIYYYCKMIQELGLKICNIKLGNWQIKFLKIYYKNILIEITKS